MPLVFVYGPDTLQSRMYDRIGPSEVVGPAVLRGHALVFDKPNMKDPNEGLANLHKEPEGQVFGLVYELSNKQLETLDGYYGGYGRQVVDVSVLGSDGSEARKKAEAWIARRTKSGLHPSQTSLDLTRRGAEENGAPPEFLRALSLFRTSNA